MRKWNVEAAIKSMEQHKQCLIDSWGGFGNMSEIDKARCDEIDNCIAQLYNTSPGHWSRWVTIQLDYVFPQCAERVMCEVMQKVSNLFEDAVYFHFDQTEDTNVIIDIEYDIEPVPGVEVTKTEVAKKLTLDELSNISFIHNPSIQVEVEDEYE